MDKISEYKDLLESFQCEVEKVHRECCGFAYDGPVNSHAWFSSHHKPKILFLLKETYGFFGDDIHKFMDGPERFNDSRTNRIISKLAYAITDHEIKTDKDFFKLLDPIYDGLASVNTDELMQCFSVLAIIEIKKVSGESISSDDDILKHAEEFSGLLTKQIKFLKPDVIFCGSSIVWQSLTEKLDVIDKTTIFPVESRVHIVDDLILYKSYHPSYRYFNFYDCMFDLTKSLMTWTLAKN